MTMIDPVFEELPSGRVICTLGAFICSSDSVDGDYDKRAQEARDKVMAAYIGWSQPVGKIVDVVV